MRIASWNINGMKARRDFLLHWLRSRQPDVVGLQELKMADAAFPALEFEAEGYHAAVHGQPSWNGVAVLSKHPVDIVQRGLPAMDRAGARLVTARTAEVTFCTIYCPNGKTLDHPDFALKLDWYDALLSHLEAEHSPNDSLVLCGDFNVCPAALDSWNEDLLSGGMFHTAKERDKIQRLLDWGLVDVFREKNLDTRAFSWWDYRGGAFHRKQGLRIDLVLATRAVADRVRDAWIDRDYRKKKDGMIASDHAPVVADLD